MIQLDIKFLSKDVDGVFSVRCDINRYIMYGIPREKIQDAINKLPEGLQGVYFLVNTNESKISKRYLYIGQTKQGPQRLIDHRQKKSDWNMAYMFLADKSNLSLQIADELEAYEIQRFLDSEKYNIVNTRSNKAEISDIAIQFSESIEEVLQFFGYDPYPNDIKNNLKPNLFKITRNGTEGILEVVSDKFVILAGSKIVKEYKPYVSKNVVQIFNEQLNKGNFDNDGIFYKTKQDVEFSSPSSAGEFVTGSSINGWSEFKNNEGKTLSEIIRKQQ